MTARAHTKSTFSRSEQKVLEIIGRRKMTIAEITDKFYDGEERPLNDIIYVASVIRRINRKCTYYGKTWSLTGEGAGRAGRTVWRQNDKRRSNPRKNKSNSGLGLRAP